VITAECTHSSSGWSYSADFAQFREHDDDVAVVFPQHSPEIFGRLSERTLRRDVRPPKAVTLHAHNHRITPGTFMSSDTNSQRLTRYLYAVNYDTHLYVFVAIFTKRDQV